MKLGKTKIILSPESTLSYSLEASKKIISVLTQSKLECILLKLNAISRLIRVLDT